MPDILSIPLRNRRANTRSVAKRAQQHRSEFRKMVEKKLCRFGLALLLVGLLVVLDIALAARTVHQLAPSEVHAGISPASSVR
jgi:hypothetical protein